jgi:hypothetical protein
MEVEWYDAEKTEPPDDMPVLASLRACITPFTTRFVCLTVMYVHHGEWRFHDSSQRIFTPNHYVDHWMPLPEPMWIDDEETAHVHQEPVKAHSLMEDIADALGAEMIPMNDGRIILRT